MRIYRGNCPQQKQNSNREKNKNVEDQGENDVVAIWAEKKNTINVSSYRFQRELVPIK